MKHLGDIQKINGAQIEKVWCITFGAPCQDLSVAGKRAGMKHSALGDEETTRSGLFMEAVRIIKEMREDDLRQICSGRSDQSVRPRFAVYENVPGALSSSGGEDFRVVLEELVRIAEPTACIPRLKDKKGRDAKWTKSGVICGDTWSLAWRIMDAQYWGVPQRRRRLAVVVDLGGHMASEILFERESLSGHSCESIKTWEGIARDPQKSTGGCGEPSSYTLQIRSGCDGGGKGALVQTEQSATLSTVQSQTLFT